APVVEEVAELALRDPGVDEVQIRRVVAGDGTKQCRGTEAGGRGGRAETDLEGCFGDEEPDQPVGDVVHGAPSPTLSVNSRSPRRLGYRPPPAAPAPRRSARRSSDRWPSGSSGRR